MKGLVVGIVSRTKDDGKVSTVLHLSGCKFNDYDQTADICKGSKVDTVFVSRKVECNPGDTLIVDYEKGYEGRAVVSDITVIPKEPKK